jgi:hypothetical protein
MRRVAWGHQIAPERHTRPNAFALLREAVGDIRTHAERHFEFVIAGAPAGLPRARRTAYRRPA